VKKIAASVSLAICLLTLTVESASAKSFKNCTELRKIYKNGVAKTKATAGTSKAHVSSSIYLANRSKDRDKDGVVCES